MNAVKEMMKKKENIILFSILSILLILVVFTGIRNQKLMDPSAPTPSPTILVPKESKAPEKEETETEEKESPAPTVSATSKPQEEQKKTDNSKIPPTTNPSTPESPPTPTLTQEQKNNQTRNNIQATYGVTIRYGNELPGYRPRGYTPTTMTDATEINQYLNELNRTLSYYPNNFFKEMKSQGMPVTFYLVKSVPNNAFAGLTDKEFTNDIKITLTTYGLFSYTANHEIMHYIDAYLAIKMWPNSLEESWNLMNPPGYLYGSFIASYNYHATNHTHGGYFIRDYGQTNYLEDRATIFEYIMTRAYPNNGCMDRDEPIRKKADLIAQQIETYFSSVSPSVTEHWERFLK